MHETHGLGPERGVKAPSREQRPDQNPKDPLRGTDERSMDGERELRADAARGAEQQ